MIDISTERRRTILSALRRGTVPAEDLDMLAVGLEKIEPLITGEIEDISLGEGSGGFKAIRGDYGHGKTFTTRWLLEQARKRGFVTSEIQIDEVETPLYKLQTVYRRVVANLSTEDTRKGALRTIIDSWFYTLEEEVYEKLGVEINDETLLEETGKLMDLRLEHVTKVAPAMTSCLRRYRKALAEEDKELADGLISWISGAPNVAAPVKRQAGIKGEIDHSGALGFLTGLMIIIRDSGNKGLIVVLDEIETVQRMRGDIRDKCFNALRQLMDDVDKNRFPGLYLIITGTPPFFDGNNGISRLPPLEQRLKVDFATDAKFDNINAVQIRLTGFDEGKLIELATRVRDIYASGSASSERLLRLVDDNYLKLLAKALLGSLGDDVGIAPRLFLKKLVGDVLDRCEQHEGFNPRQHYELTIDDSEMTEQERAARQPASDVNDIELEI